MGAKTSKPLVSLTLARAGVEVVTASVMPDRRTNVTLARGLKVTADSHISDESADPYDAIILPGGMPGGKHLGESKELVAILQSQKSKNKLYGAICASPAVALGPNGLLDGVAKATCFPFLKDKMPESLEFSNDAVVCSNNCITSQGPGTALKYALTIAAILVSPAKAVEVAKGMLLDYSETDLVPK